VDRISIAYNGLCATQNAVYRDWQLEERAQKSGFAIVPIAKKSARLHIEINYSSSNSPKNLVGIPRENRVLFALEPRAVLPMQHRKRVKEKFGLVLVSSPNQLQHPRDVFFDYGFLFPKDNMKFDSPRKIGSLALLNANKSSFVSGSQYKTRKSLVNRLASLGFFVTIAGAGWSKSFQEQTLDSMGSLLFCLSQGEWPDLSRFSFPTRPKRPNIKFSGAVPDGNVFLQQHEFALIVENDPDYISEKLFNALESGCIPLYLGPRLSTLGIPETVIVDLTRETDSSLLLLRSDSNRKELVRMAGQSYIKRPDVKEYWSHESGILRFFEALAAHLKNQVRV
jgi:hypothetical protein